MKLRRARVTQGGLPARVGDFAHALGKLLIPISRAGIRRRRHSVSASDGTANASLAI